MEINRLSYSEICQKVTKLYEENIPFVVFKKPNSEEIELFHQIDNQIFIFQNSFWGDGFVMTPFDNEKQKSIFIKAEKKYIAHKDATPLIQNIKTDFSFCEADKVRHIQLVERAIEEMKLGKMEKVVLSRRIIRSYDGNVVHTFERMIHRYGDVFCYLFSHPSVGVWLSATPETLLTFRNNRIQTMALAGTQPAKEGHNVVWKTKEKEEQQIVTDAIIEQIAPYVDDMKISDCQTVKAGNILHLCTNISATLREEENPFMIAGKLHPTPAVCGFPHLLAKDFILKEEGYDRSFYTGYCGVVQKESIDFFVNLRCVQIAEKKAFIYVGGGILKESVPLSEWEETQNKAQTMLSVL